MEIAIAVAVALLAGGVGFTVGRSGRGRSLDRARAAEAARTEVRIRAVADSVSRGDLPADGAPGTPEADLRRALAAGWAPRGVEHQRALREALERVAGFLHRQVAAQLTGVGADAGAEELRERIERALGTLQDLESFLEEPGEERGAHNVSDLAQRVTREFAADQAVMVRLSMAGPVRASVNAPAFMDALYLVLHNAARFGGDGNAVRVTVLDEAGRATVRIRDHGPGFTEEALRRAFDPFYSTTEDGLGLGLPHARRMLEGMGGRIELRNAPDGGGEVEISLSGS